MANSKNEDPDILETPELAAFLAREYGEALAAAPDGLSRRRFLQLMSASLALAGIDCRRDVTHLLPESRRPQGHVPGALSHFATAMELAGVALPLIATSFEGRPIKIDGNPAHPASQGGSSVLAQASILELYDPDRSRSLVRRGTESKAANWDDFVAFARQHFGDLRDKRGARLAILSEASSSPTLAAQRAELARQVPEATWYEYEPLSRDSEREGARLAFGQPLRPTYNLTEARIVFCLDADLLGDHPDSIRLARDFARRRQPQEPWMSRWYAAEATLSLTGACADHRLALRPSQLPALLATLAATIGKALGKPGLGAVDSALLAEPSVAAFVAAAAEDLLANRGHALVTVGPRQPAATHALAFTLNVVLGNVGKAQGFTLDSDPQRPTHLAAIKALSSSLMAGAIDTVVIMGGNPVYDAPADVAFAQALAKAKETIHLSLYEDETSALCTWHLPRAHYLEAWGDTCSWDGQPVLQQPLIAPLYGGKSLIELLATLLGNPIAQGQQLVRETFARNGGNADAWRECLRSGVVPHNEPGEARLPALKDIDFGAVPAAVPLGQGIEVVFTTDSRVYDGRFANNPWLQELPDPISKLVWDNAALLSPKTAASLGVESGDVLELTHQSRSVQAPAWIVPGIATGAVVTALGGGRRAAGHVGGGRGTTQAPGVDMFALRATTTQGHAARVNARPTGQRYTLATAQHQYDIDAIGKSGEIARVPEIVRRATLTDFRKRPDFALHVVAQPPPAALWKEPNYPGHRWGMAIDLNACIGCGACMVACQAENNVPVVGKTQVERHRIMHWLRVDRYFEGNDEAPEVSLQPVTCQQCETAPCESVCPVAATVHSDEGLNQQVYNRCVGTRYCANNCPYKVRRFNYFNYHKNMNEAANEVLKLANNPDVTVRSRGVMEKCTFCVQRIERVKITARNDKKPIADGEVMPACAQACPTHAITFGDLNDTGSEVRHAHQSPRAYGLLAELNTKPRNAYLARVTNPHPRLAKERP